MSAKLVFASSLVLAAAGLTGCAGDATGEGASADSDLTGADSVYTDLGENCRTFHSEEGGIFTRSECGGVGSFEFVLEQGDARYSAAVRTQGGEVDLRLWAGELQNWPAPKMSGAFQSIGPRVEWRIAPNAFNEPHALIFRIIDDRGPQVSDGENHFLVVAKLGSDRGACLYRIVDGNAADANVSARKAADEARTGSCPTR